ncbi:hypothetical protein Y032_0009g775 [Ancylostoma ceylanicum]|uniref:Uncharacterized protein n=1 Tax=Ancylostoma ceylanicum TaxID=53326 RepID=A0A016VIV1_9BILA|nr:hypothetical protein Y032_0009g775 [Ancylostoma ceylanicum]
MVTQYPVNPIDRLRRLPAVHSLQRYRAKVGLPSRPASQCRRPISGTHSLERTKGKYSCIARPSIAPVQPEHTNCCKRSNSSV